MRKDFEKQTKIIEDQGEKQVNALKSLESSDKQLPSIKGFMSKEKLNPEIADEIEKIEEEERKADRSKMVYEGSNKTYDFRKFKTIRVLGNEIRNNSARALLKGREILFKAFETGIFLKPEELKKGTGLKILTPKQMLQRLLIALAQIKADYNSETLLN